MIGPASRQICNARDAVVDDGAVPHRGTEHLVTTVRERIDECLQTLAVDEHSCLIDWEIQHRAPRRFHWRFWLWEWERLIVNDRPPC